MNENNDHKPVNNQKTDFETRFENFHEKHPEPWEIFPIEMSLNLIRSTNCSTRFLLILKSIDTIDNPETVTDMLLVKKSLESKFGASNIYLIEGDLGWLRLYVFFDFEELLSRAVKR
tara:strand:+ start:298 stop:648 length:351 start_codon:yes stop_codon:yes gene_type:complete